MLQAILLEVIDGMRPRTHHAHFAPQYVPQLRQFIQAIAPEKLADRGDARVGGDLETWALRSLAARRPSFNRSASRPWCET